MEFPEGSSLALKKKTLEKNEQELNNLPKYKKSNAIILMFFGLTVYTSISEFIVVSFYFMAISASEFFSLLLIIVGVVNIVVCAKILHAQLTQIVNIKIHLVLVLFTTLFIIKIVFFFRYLKTNESDGKELTTIEICNRKFPMAGIYWFKMICGVVYEIIAVFSFQVVNSKVRKYKIIKECFMAELEKFKINNIG